MTVSPVINSTHQPRGAGLAIQVQQIAEASMNCHIVLWLLAYVHGQAVIDSTQVALRLVPPVPHEVLAYITLKSLAHLVSVCAMCEIAEVSI